MLTAQAHLWPHWMGILTDSASVLGEVQWLSLSGHFSPAWGSYGTEKGVTGKNRAKSNILTVTTTERCKIISGFLSNLFISWLWPTWSRQSSNLGLWLRMSRRCVAWCSWESQFLIWILSFCISFVRSEISSLIWRCQTITDWISLLFFRLKIVLVKTRMQ